MFLKTFSLYPSLIALILLFVSSLPSATGHGRDRIRLSTSWRFKRFEDSPDNLIYDLRPDRNDSDLTVLKPWILPSANDFIKDPANRHEPPGIQPNINVTFAQTQFDDIDWEIVSVPHDWAIAGPFQSQSFLSSMGSLPVYGVGWYRHKFSIPFTDRGRKVYLEVDGAMSYAMVWLNGALVGGWPYGYNSFHLDLTPFLRYGQSNVLAIRTENPWNTFSRWYPGAGLFRNVWITKTSSIHVCQWGTQITSRDVSRQSATLDLVVEIKSMSSNMKEHITVTTGVYEVDAMTGEATIEVGHFPAKTLTIVPGEKIITSSSLKLGNPRLWGPPPSQVPNLYMAFTRILSKDLAIDEYGTTFGIRSLQFTPNGTMVNSRRIYIRGVNLHHDHGALGAAYNHQAAERQLRLLQEMGVNAIRTSHNPPAPEFLELTDRMGFLVLDEVFDVWEQAKTPADTHLIFADWHEPDIRAFIRRDRNHPSVFMWSYGNEVPEQQSSRGAEIATTLGNIMREEDSRVSTCSLNLAQPNQSLPGVVDAIALNYQGEGIRYGPGYDHLIGNRRSPQYDAFHEKFPEKVIFGSEVAWSLSTRGSFLFSPTNLTSAPANDTNGGSNSTAKQISAYELYTSQAGSSPERVFATQDTHPFVAGGFVWVGWDHLGEPYPFESRSTISGIIDLAGFKKERFYLYQARWRPDLPTVKIIPHWTWPARVGKVTPVHVFTSADEGELFINGRSQGRISKTLNEYRFRWDEVIYVPGEVHVRTWKNGNFWANDTVRTAGKPASIRLFVENSIQIADEKIRNLRFIRASIVDAQDVLVPEANDLISFEASGPGALIATDNGSDTDYTPFGSFQRKAFNGLILAVVRVTGTGEIVIKAQAEGLGETKIVLMGF